MGLMWWMLAREVLRMRGTISREHPWEVMPDLYFYRDPEEVGGLGPERVTRQNHRIIWNPSAAPWHACAPDPAPASLDML